LQECRKQVSLVIRKMGHEDIAMEYYAAEDQRPVDRCLADVAACDVYIGIFAWRYGWVPPDENSERRSITEMEYRHAVRMGKPCLMFLLEKDAAWPFSNIELGALPRIEALREELARNHVMAFFRSAQDIAEVVAPALHRWAEEHGMSTGTLDEFTLKPYYDYLRLRYRHMDLDALTPPERDEHLRMQLRSLYVEQSVREMLPPVEIPKELWQRLEREREVREGDLPAAWDPDSIERLRKTYNQTPTLAVVSAILRHGSQRAVILGDPGSGKSTLIRFLTLALIDPDTSPQIRESLPGWIPLPIELKTYIAWRREGRCQDFLDLLECQSHDHQWDIASVKWENHLSQVGRVLVLFDGLDEIFDPDEREVVAQQIVLFAGRYPKTRVLVTSRLIGYNRHVLEDRGFVHFTLQDLGRTQVLDFTTRWYQLALGDHPEAARERRDRILQAYDTSPALQQLAGNPLLLTIMAIIAKNQELPRERWKLYEHASEVLIHHWDDVHHRDTRETKRDLFGVEEKKSLLRRLAFRMQEGRGGLPGNYIHQNEVEQVFEEALQLRGLALPEAITYTRQLIHDFRERNFILAWYGGGLYGFVHRAFLEYFCALEFVRRFHAGELTLDQLLQDVYGLRWQERSWHETLRLISSMLDQRWADAIIEFLTAQEKPGDEPWNLVLAVHCVEDQRSPQTLPASGRLLRALCEWLIAHPHSAWRGSFAHLQLIQPAMDLGGRWSDREGLIHETWVLAASAPGRVDDLLGDFLGDVGTGLPRMDRALEFLCVSVIPQVRQFALSVLIAGWYGLDRIRSLVLDRATNDESDAVRESVMMALARRFATNSETLHLLLDRATHDQSATVRGNSVTALAQYFAKEPRTLPLLLEHAANDKEEYVRDSALSALAQQFSSEPQTLPLLLDRAAHDQSATVRGTATAALARHFPSDPQTLPLLLNSAVSVEDPLGRRSAVAALARYFPRQPETLPIVLDRAEHDQDERVRQSALSALAQYFSNEPETLRLLLDHAVRDKYESVRDSAVYAVAQYFSSEPETLRLLLDRAANDTPVVRLAAVVGLAQQFSTRSEALLCLLDRVEHDQNWAVRHSALKALVERFSAYSQTLALLVEQVASGQNADIRLTSVASLAKHFSTQPATLPLLLDCAAHDPDAQVRQTALAALTRHFSAQPEILSLLLQAAVDQSVGVRESALDALGRYFSAHPKTLPVLLDHAALDHHIGVRRVAVAALTRKFYSQTKILSVLSDRAARDEDSDVRYLSVCYLAEHQFDDQDIQELLQRLAKTDPYDLVRLRINFACEQRFSPWKRWLTGVDTADTPPALPEGVSPRLEVAWVRLRNIRAFEDSGEIEIPGRHSLLVGENSVGKSTLLRCIALAALGVEFANQAERRPGSYLRDGADRAFVEVVFRLYTGSDTAASADEFVVGLEIRKGETSFRATANHDLNFGEYNCATRLDILRRRSGDDFGFFCGYGSLRTFADPASLMPAQDKAMIDRVASLFDAHAPVTDPDLLAKLLSGSPANIRGAPDSLKLTSTDSMRKALQDLLPYCGEWSPSATGEVPLRECAVPFRDLSDGYASLVAMIGHMFRHALAAAQWTGDPAAVRGVALIDEVDAHLHPAWQRRVLPDLHKVFPNLQIIATTHSPMVAGSVETASVRVLRRDGPGVKVIAGLPSIEGWRADQVLTSILFDLPTSRSQQTEELFRRYANRLAEYGPDDEEVKRLGPQVASAMQIEGEGKIDEETHRVVDRLLSDQFQQLDETTRRLVLAKAGLVLAQPES
jgi:HEAT repeat protein/predicted ATPase